MSEAIISRDAPSSNPSDSLTTAAGGLVILPVRSLWQPFLGLIHERIKKHETRSFRLPTRLIGKWIGLHATATFPAMRHISEELNDLCTDVWGCGYNTTLPKGAITCAVRFSAPIPTEEALPDAEDRTAGDYSGGRWAWPIVEVYDFAKQIPAKGKQGWWSHPLPLAAGQALGGEAWDGSETQKAQAQKDPNHV